MIRLIRSTALGAALVALALPQTAGAEVTLSLDDQSIVIRGTITSTDDNSYTIETAYGTFTLPIDGTNCEGADCPEIADLLQEIRIATSPAFLTTLLPEAVAGIATQSGQRIQANALSEQAFSSAILSTEDETVATFEAKASGASAAFDALLAGDADVILTERRATNAEIEAFLDAGFGDLTSSAQETIFGQDGVVFVVSPNNPVKSISVAQSEAIFAGTITNWSQLGGPDAPITVYAPDSGSAVSNYFSDTVLDENFSSYAGSVDRSLNERRIDAAVAQNPGAIGLTSSANVVAAHAVDLGSSCGIETKISDFTLSAEDYPMARRLYAYTTNRFVPSRVKELLAFLGSDAGQQVVNKSGFVNLETQQADLNSFGQRLAYGLSSADQASEIANLRGFAGEVLAAERLSTTFRFATGSSQLDNKARADISRLTSLLQQPQYQGAEITLIGFTDSIGSGVINTVLSQRRAAQVLDELRLLSGGDAASISVRTTGFGASNPVACNDTEAGRELNRRVEVWVR